MTGSSRGAKFTRRKWAAALAPAADSPAGPGEELRIARERIRNNADALAKVKLPMATEPAFWFKV
jgi:hypothetical protein